MLQIISLIAIFGLLIAGTITILWRKEIVTREIAEIEQIVRPYARVIIERRETVDNTTYLIIADSFRQPTRAYKIKSKLTARAIWNQIDSQIQSSEEIGYCSQYKSLGQYGVKLKNVI